MIRNFCPHCQGEVPGFGMIHKVFCDYCGKEITENNGEIVVPLTPEEAKKHYPFDEKPTRVIPLMAADHNHNPAVLCCLDCMIKMLMEAKRESPKALDGEERYEALARAVKRFGDVFLDEASESDVRTQALDDLVSLLPAETLDSDTATVSQETPRDPK